jgi:hypothetical protein
MRARFLVASLMAFAGIASACLPEPTQDYDDFKTRLNDALAAAKGDGGGATIEAGPPPTEAVKASYAASCLTELANGQISKVFTFWTDSSFTPNAAGNGGTLSLILTAEALVNKEPPPTVGKAGFTGQPLPEILGTTDANGSFVATLKPDQTASFPGLANPISGSDVLLTNENGVVVGLKGRYATDHFCARLTGHVKQPAAAERNLDEDSNFCLFQAVKDGDPTPQHMFKDYSVANCPE